MTFVLLNGPSAVGKSTLASALVSARPLALALDIDEIRTRLGQWETHPDAKQVARSVGVATAAAHLSGGFDVVLPQLVARVDFIELLERVATEAAAPFVEVMLRADVDALVERFLRRRAAFAAEGRAHPQDDVALEEVRELLERTVTELDRVVAVRPGTIVVDANGDPSDTREAVEAALA